MTRIRHRLVSSFICSTVLVACYGNHPHQPDPKTFQSSRSTASLSVVEVNDRGNFWYANQAISAIDTVLDRARKGNTVVVLFVHGWGHDAQTRDQNLVCFSHTLESLSQRLNPQAPTLAGNASSNSGPASSPTYRVVGIYVGWRGKSLPEGPGLTSIISRLPTFWARKGTAAKIGRGDLRAFVERLGGIYDSINYGPENPTKSARRTDTTFSLVTVGHSFGGQALFPAVASHIEDQLQANAGDSAWHALRNHPTQPSTKKAFIAGLGDLVVLVNPAMEALAYERMNRLAKSLEFSNVQTPALIVFDAQNDYPRRWLFPIGRSITTAFAAGAEPHDRERDRVVLGRYSPQITHRLNLDSNPGFAADTFPRPKGAKDNPFDLESGDCGRGFAAESGPTDQLSETLKRDPLGTDVTGEWHISGKHIAPISDKPQPYAPVLVVRSTEKQIINGHNGFFQPNFVDFLIRYVTDIQTKRFAVRDARRDLANRYNPRKGR